MADTDWGIKISKDGFGVGTASDKDLIMSSSFNMLKTSSVGTLSGTGVQTSNHGLSYAPAIMFAENFGTSSSFMGQINTTVGVDGTVVAINGGVGGGTVRYYVFYQDAI